MKGQRRIIPAIIILVVVLAALITGVHYALNLRMAPPLQLKPPASSTPSLLSSSPATATPPSEAVPPVEPYPIPPLSVTAIPSPTPLSLQACGVSGARTFLIVGESSTQDTRPRGADAIRLVRANFDRLQVQVVTLPPDLWVQSAILADSGVKGATLTRIYYQARKAAPGTDQEKIVAALLVLAQTLYDDFGFPAEHYVVLRPEIFLDMVDTLGGVDITLDQAVDGRAENLGYFPAGSQHLTAQQVLDLVRIYGSTSGRAPTEAERISRQNLVIQAIYRDILRPENWPQVPALIVRFRKDVVTDLSANDLIDLACLLRVPDLKIDQAEVGEKLVTRGEDMILYPYTEQIRQFLFEKLGP